MLNQAGYNSCSVCPMTVCELGTCGVQLKDMVTQQAAHDVDPPLSETASYIKNEMSKEGYRHLLAVGKLTLLGIYTSFVYLLAELCVRLVCQQPCALQRLLRGT